MIEENKVEEKWITISENKKYEVSSLGRVRNKKYLKPSIVGGYYRIGLCDNGIQRTHYVHILVAQYFCDNPENKPIVNHQDGNKLNNHYTNLEWVTHTENSKHADALGLNKRVSKRVHQYAREDKDKLEPLRTFNSLKEAAEFLEIKGAIGHISAVCTGVRGTAYGYRWGYEKEIV